MAVSKKTSAKKKAVKKVVKKKTAIASTVDPKEKKAVKPTSKKTVSKSSKSVKKSVTKKPTAAKVSKSVSTTKVSADAKSKAVEKKVKKKVEMPTLQELLEAGAHFGHKVSRWNPEMDQYIFDKRNGIHIIDLTKTLSLLKDAVDFMTESSEKGNVLLVGTKGQAATMIKNAGVDHGAFYISKRWPGGLLTNFKKVHQSVDRLVEIEENLAAKKGYETKKEKLVLERERDRLSRLYEGIVFMSEIPAVMIVVDTKVEKIAIKEARRLGVKIVGIVDTNCDPNLVDYPIPANDDAIKSLTLFMDVLIHGFSNSAKSSELIGKRNDYAARLERTNQATIAREEQEKREAESEAKRLKSMRDGQISGETEKVERKKVVRVVRGGSASKSK